MSCLDVIAPYFPCLSSVMLKTSNMIQIYHLYQTYSSQTNQSHQLSLGTSIKHHVSAFWHSPATGFILMRPMDFLLWINRHPHHQLRYHSVLWPHQSPNACQTDKPELQISQQVCLRAIFRRLLQAERWAIQSHFVMMWTTRKMVLLDQPRQ